MLEVQVDMLFGAVVYQASKDYQIDYSELQKMKKKRKESFGERALA